MSKARNVFFIALALILVLISGACLWYFFRNPSEVQFLLGSVISLLGLIIDILVLVRDSSKPEERSALLTRTPQEMIERLTDRGETAWVPRTDNPARWLPDCPRTVFVGPSGVGKSREALEIAQAAMSEAYVGPSIGKHLLIPNPDAPFEDCTRADLEHDLSEARLSGAPVILWLDDCHRLLHSESCRRNLDILVSLLEAREMRVEGARLYILAATRPGHTDDQTWDWLSGHGIKQRQIRPPDSVAMAKSIAEVRGITLDQRALDLLHHAADHRPALLDLAIHSLKDEGLTTPGDDQVERLRQLLTSSLHQLWRDTERAGLCTNSSANDLPAVRVLLRSLALFHAAQVPAFDRMVMAYARKNVKGRWPAKTRETEKARQLLLRHRYFRIQASRWSVPDYVLETEPGIPDQAATLNELSQFALQYRRRLRLPLLRHLHFERGQHARFAINVGLAYTYKNRGSAYDDQRKYRLAVQNYDRAIELDPDYAKTYYNRSLAHHTLGRLPAACADMQRALELDPTLDPPDWYDDCP